MNRWKAILAALLIFASGVGTGILGHRTVSHATRPTPRDSRFPPSGSDGRLDFLSRLKRDLTLTDEQATRIDAILQEGRKRNRQIWDSVQPQLREEMKQVRERIHVELNPEQRTKYDEIMARPRERRGPRPDGGPGSGSGFGPGPGPGPKPEGGWRRGERGGSPAAGSTNAATAGAPPADQSH